VYCGICHTDVVYAENKRGNTKFPLVPGHELAGIVTKVIIIK
jgi:D-arabinose 1-dehydrogenase-like Zn-dependent alcohol dehydrogenase